MDWNTNVMGFQHSLKKWNQEIFGKKKIILRRLNGIAQKLTVGSNQYLEKLQQELWSEYEEILFQEEICGIKNLVANGCNLEIEIHDTSMEPPL